MDQIINKRFQLKTHQKKLPDGRTTTLDIIDHPGATLIVPFLSEDQIIFLWQYRPAFDKYIYELPAGTLDPNEELEVCAQRELQEETGYRSNQFTHLGQILPVPGYSTEIIQIYKAENLVEDPLEGDMDEVIEIKIFSKDQIKTLFQNGEIQDAKTLSALVMAGII